MPRAVDGTYGTPSNSVSPAVASTTIDPDDFNSLVGDMETAISDTVYTTGLAATDNLLTRSDGTNGKRIQTSVIAVDDSGNTSGIGTLITSGVATVGTTAGTAVKVDPSGFVEFPEVAAPSTPASGFLRAYAKTDGKLYQKNDAGTETDLSSAGGGGASGHGQCRLTKSSTNLLLSPFDGNYLIVNATACTVPDAGVTLAPTSLAANTTYYIYATASAGAINAMEASTTVPVISTATGNKGVFIKTADETRTLVGMARTSGSTAWVDSTTQRFTISYFNRRDLATVNALTSNFTTTSTSFVEAMASNRVEFLTWADELCECSVVTYNFHSGLDYTITKASFDGSNDSFALATYGTNGYPCTVLHEAFLAVGYHYATALGKVQTSGTGTWQGNASISQTNVHAITRG